MADPLWDSSTWGPADCLAVGLVALGLSRAVSPILLLLVELVAGLCGICLSKVYQIGKGRRHDGE